MTTRIDDTAALARIQQFADWFNLSVPALERDSDGNIVLTDELADWMGESGASWDWIFLGDAKVMAASLRDREARNREVSQLIGKMADDEHRILVELLEQHHREGTPMEEVLADFRDRIEAHRGGRMI